MKRYSLELKLFALEKRKVGSGWGEIRRAIKGKFEIEPPTIRAMQRWEKELKTREGLNQALIEYTRKESEDLKGQALTQIADGLLPRLWIARNAGEDIEYSGWRWFFEIQEGFIGVEKFWRYLDRYRAEK